MNRTGIALLVATLALSLSLSVVAAPVTTSITINQGWNMIAFPTVPLSPDPADVFSGYSDQGVTGSDAIYYSLFRYDPIRASNPPYDPDDPTWGNLLIGDGYQLFRKDPGPVTVSYQGVDVSGDHWLSLPRAGWTLIGYPNNTPASVDYEDLLVTNGIVTKTIQEAIEASWLSEFAYHIDTLTGSNKMVGIDEDPPWNTLQINKGYWFFTFQDNLALIVPGA